MLAQLRLAIWGLSLVAANPASARPSAWFLQSSLLPTYLDFLEGPQRTTPLGSAPTFPQLLLLPSFDIEPKASSTSSVCNAGPCEFASRAVRLVHELHRWTLFTTSSTQPGSGATVHWVRIIPTRFSDAYGITAQAAF